MQAVSAVGRTHWVLIRRLNSSCRRSIALVVRNDFHWLGGYRRKVVRHGRYVTFQLAEVAIARALFAENLRLIDRLQPAPLPP